MINLSAFKAYDVRGRIPDEINADLVYQIGRAYAAFVKPKRVCVGRDIRLTSDQFAKAADARTHRRRRRRARHRPVWHRRRVLRHVPWKLDGGIMVTASHNPPDYNGLKLVREQSKPIGSDTGLKDIAAMIAERQTTAGGRGEGQGEKLDTSAHTSSTCWAT